VRTVDEGSRHEWDAITGRELLVLHRHENAVMPVNFFPGGLRLMTAVLGRSVKFWRAYDWTITREQLEQQKLERYRAFMAGDGEQE